MAGSRGAAARPGRRVGPGNWDACVGSWDGLPCAGGMIVAGVGQEGTGRVQFPNGINVAVRAAARHPWQGRRLWGQVA
jgi:hypothetical protein